MEKHTVGLMYRLMYAALNSEANIQDLADSFARESAFSHRMTDALEQVCYFVSAQIDYFVVKVLLEKNFKLSLVLAFKVKLA